MKKSFSLLEIIFIITIISVIVVVAVPKLFYNIDEANIIKLKADVIFIRNGINKFKNQQILLNQNDSLSTLENGIMPRLSNEAKSGNWTKTSQDHYNAWISSQIAVEFIYDANNLSFTCDEANDEYCKKLSQ